ncbi:MAG: hypothetical protein HY617_00930 [Candidatus Sungbacteria bacterium]|nr:hypothetical protein [Candidatus Sungbacteria bacterium]
MLQKLQGAIARVSHRELEEPYKKIIPCEFCEKNAEFAAVYNVMKSGVESSFSVHHCGQSQCVTRAAHAAVALGYLYQRTCILFHIFKILIEFGFIEQDFI